MATFTVIVGTAGRKTLRRTLRSITRQLEPGDELFLLRDESGDAGDTPRNQTMHRAAGSHLLFMDDDDVYVRGAFARMRRFADDNPGRIGIFRIEYTTGPKRWRVPELRNRNVSTQNFLVPNVPGKLGVWEHRGTVHGDYVFIEETARLQGEPIFVDEVTVRVRPIRNPFRRLYVRVRYRLALGTRLRSLRERRHGVGPGGTQRGIAPGEQPRGGADQRSDQR